MSRKPSFFSSSPPLLPPLEVTPPATLTALISPVVSAVTFNAEAVILPFRLFSSDQMAGSANKPDTSTPPTVLPSLLPIAATFTTLKLLMATPIPTAALSPLAVTATIALVALVSLVAPIFTLPLLSVPLFAFKTASSSTLTTLILSPSVIVTSPLIALPSLLPADNIAPTWKILLSEDKAISPPSTAAPSPTMTRELVSKS